MSAKLYTLKLTKAELWVLKEAYHASWTAPEMRSELELSIAERLDALYHRAWSDSKVTTGEPK